MESPESEIKKNAKDFSVTNNKIVLSSELKLMEWCPTRDLIAVVNVENIITIHRYFSWNRLMSINAAEESKAELTSITWRPDGTRNFDILKLIPQGKMLATGFSDGTCRLYSIESKMNEMGTTLIGKAQDCVSCSSTQAHDSAVMILKWIKYEGIEKNSSRVRIFCASSSLFFSSFLPF